MIITDDCDQMTSDRSVVRQVTSTRHRIDAHLSWKMLSMVMRTKCLDTWQGGYNFSHLRIGEKIRRGDDKLSSDAGPPIHLENRWFNHNKDIMCGDSSLLETYGVVAER